MRLPCMPFVVLSVADSKEGGGAGGQGFKTNVFFITHPYSNLGYCSSIL